MSVISYDCESITSSTSMSAVVTEIYKPSTEPRRRLFFAHEELQFLQEWLFHPFFVSPICLPFFKLFICSIITSPCWSQTIVHFRLHMQYFHHFLLLIANCDLIGSFHNFYLWTWAANDFSSYGAAMNLFPCQNFVVLLVVSACLRLFYFVKTNN